MITCNTEGHALGIYSLDPSILHPSMFVAFRRIIGVAEIPRSPVICAPCFPSYLLTAFNCAKFLFT